MWHRIGFRLVHAKSKIMKKFILIAAVGLASAFYQPAKAQVSVSINIGAQPQWGPRGYDYVDYYYLPEINSYYYVPTRQFVYLERNRWVHRPHLPNRYRNYNLYSARKVVINRPHPYLERRVYTTSYSRPVVRNSAFGRPQYRYERHEQRFEKHGRDRHRGGKGHRH